MGWSSPPPVRNPNKTNATLTDVTHPEEHNDHTRDINNIVAELGPDPSGASANVTDRLTSIDGAIVAGDNTLQSQITAANSQIASLQAQISVIVGRLGADYDGAFSDLTARLEDMDSRIQNNAGPPPITPGIWLNSAQLAKAAARLAAAVDPQNTVFTTVSASGGMQRGSAGVSSKGTHSVSGTWPSNFNAGTADNDGLTGSSTGIRASQRQTFHSGDFTAATAPSGWPGGTDDHAVPAPVPVLRIPTQGGGASTHGDQGWVQAFNNATGTTDIYPAGDMEFLDDMRAAYTHALMSAIDPNSTFRTAHAQRAFAFINAWSSTLQSIAYDNEREQNIPGASTAGIAYNAGSRVWGNTKLVVAWSTQLLCRAASILRYTREAEWLAYSSTSLVDLNDMIRNILHPHLAGTGGAGNSATRGWWGGNWMASIADAWIACGVYLGDVNMRNDGLAFLRRSVPAIIFKVGDKGLAELGETADCPFPQARGSNNADTGTPATNYNTLTALKSNWGWGLTTPSTQMLFTITGTNQEIVRDCGHVTMGQGAIAAACETMWHQGIDLYEEFSDRLIPGFEMTARALVEYHSGGGRWWNGASGSTGVQDSTNWAPTIWPVAVTNPTGSNSINQQFSLGGSNWRAGWEVFYNHYKNRAQLNTGVGGELEWTHKLLTTAPTAALTRPSMWSTHLLGETMSHGEIDNPAF